MSLIIDINPVPWEILEQVKARLLKNRANRQKRQPEKDKELRRVMRVDNGILAKQRWDEPSFIGGRDRVFAICFNAPIETLIYKGFQLPVSYTVSINGQTLGNLNFGITLNRTQAYYFIWPADEDDKTQILNNLYRNHQFGAPETQAFDPFDEFSDIVVTVPETEQPDPNAPIVIEITNLTGVADTRYVPNGVGFPNLFALYFQAAFSFDEEFPRKAVGFRGFGYGAGGAGLPDKIIFKYNNWK